MPSIFDSDVLPVVWFAAVAAPVGRLTVPLMFVMFQVPLCVAAIEAFARFTESAPLVRHHIRAIWPSLTLVGAEADA